MPNSQSKETPSNKGTETSRQVQKAVRRDDSTKSQADRSEANSNSVETIIRTGSGGPHFLEQIKQNTAFVRQMIDHFNDSMRQMTLHSKQLSLFFTESAISAKQKHNSFSFHIATENNLSRPVIENPERVHTPSENEDAHGNGDISVNS
jgi:hypothetical protein